MSVRQLQANDGLTSASTECSSWQAMFFMTELQTFEPDDRRDGVMPRTTIRCLAMGKRLRERQPSMWVATTDFAMAASHPFYTD